MRCLTPLSPSRPCPFLGATVYCFSGSSTRTYIHQHMLRRKGHDREVSRAKLGIVLMPTEDFVSTYLPEDAPVSALDEEEEPRGVALVVGERDDRVGVGQAGVGRGHDGVPVGVPTLTHLYGEKKRETGAVRVGRGGQRSQGSVF
jgi:hypothetical protein